MRIAIQTSSENSELLMPLLTRISLCASLCCIAYNHNYHAAICTDRIGEHKSNVCATVSIVTTYRGEPISITHCARTSSQSYQASRCRLRRRCYKVMSTSDFTHPVSFPINDVVRRIDPHRMITLAVEYIMVSVRALTNHCNLPVNRFQEMTR